MRCALPRDGVPGLRREGPRGNLPGAFGRLGARGGPGGSAVPLLRAGIAAGRGSPCSLGAREPLGRRAAEPGERAAVPLACALATGTPLARA